MLRFKDCKDLGYFNSSKKKDYGPAWDYVVENCQTTWPGPGPGPDWDHKLVSSKYDTERRRFLQWKQLVDGYSGGTLKANGLPDVSVATWERFLRQNSLPIRKFTWLKSTPLGDPEVY